MAYETFIETQFQTKSLELLTQINAIISSYQAQNLKLTLRQLYYQLVTRNIIRNEDRAYKNLGKLLSQGRLAGMVDWDAIEDRLRKPEKAQEWDDPDHIMRTVIDAYALPRWDNQETYCEMWVEKDALAGVLQPITDELHVTLMVNRGYNQARILRGDAGPSRRLHHPQRPIRRSVERHRSAVFGPWSRVNDDRTQR